MSVNGRFIHSCSEGNMSVFNSLIALADLNSTETGTTPLIGAIMGNNFEIIERLLNHPAININKTDKNGWSALHHACFQNRVEMVNTICNARGIDLNLKDVTGKTPLMVAVLGESVRTVEKMLEIENIELFTTDKNNEDIETLARLFMDDKIFV